MHSIGLTILITGASGYVGSNLVETLAVNHKIYALVRTSPKETVEGVNYIECDFTKSKWIEKLPENIKVVIHLAQSRNYRSFPEGSFDMLNINIESTLELLEWSRKKGIQKFIFTSTGNVYSPSCEVLYEDSPLKPTSMYAATKLSAENIISQYNAIFQTVIIRIFGVYGPGQKDMLIPTIIEKIKNNELIQLANNIGLKLTPIHIFDTINAIKALVEDDKVSGCYNLCGDEEITLFQLVQEACKILNLKPSLEINSNTEKSLIGCNKLLKSKIGDFTQIKFIDGIKGLLNG